MMAATNNKNARDQREVDNSELYEILKREGIITQRNNRTYLTKSGKILLEDKDNKINSELSNQYIDARRMWDERMGYSAAREAVWKKISFVCLALTSIAVLCSVYIVTRSKFIPYVVFLDQTGTLYPGGVPHKINIEPKIMDVQLREYITAMRSFYKDDDVNNHNIDIVTSMTSTDAINKVQHYMTSQNENPKKTTVQITAVSEIPKSSSYQVDWTETQVDSDVQTYWRAVITVKQIDSLDQIDPKQYTLNLAGISVTDITISPRTSS